MYACTSIETLVKASMETQAQELIEINEGLLRWGRKLNKTCSYSAYQWKINWNSCDM